MTAIIKILNIFIFILTFCVVLFTISSCHQYYQTTKSENNSKFGSDTVYNPPFLPGAEMVIYSWGTAAYYGVSGPIYLEKPLTQKEMDSLSKVLGERFESIERNRDLKNDSLQRTDTINNEF